MLVQPNQRTPLAEVIEQSVQLSRNCLSQPWEKTDQQFRDQLICWQQALQEASNHLNMEDELAFTTSLAELNSCIQKFILVLKEKDVILLSNTLSDVWVPTLKNLSNANI